MIGRRGFLGALLGAAVLDPEKLLWVPGKKMISIPAERIKIPKIRYVLEFTRFGPVISSSVGSRADWVVSEYYNAGWDATVTPLPTLTVSNSQGVYIDRMEVILDPNPYTKWAMERESGALRVAYYNPDHRGDWVLGHGPEYKYEYQPKDENGIRWDSSLTSVSTPRRNSIGRSWK